MKKFDGVIFDMDGLLFDTELIYYTSTQKVADAMGLPYSKEVYLDYVGISDEEVQENYRRIYASYGHDTVEEFIRRSYDDTLQEFLDEQKIPRLVASSNVRPAIEMLLSHAGIQDRFVGIVSAEDVKRAKPDPEIFQKARQLLGTEAPKTLIFEDSFHGVSAAHSAGIPVIMVPDLLQPTEVIQEKTLHVLESLHQAPHYLK